MKKSILVLTTALAATASVARRSYKLTPWQARFSRPGAPTKLCSQKLGTGAAADEIRDEFRQWQPRSA